MLRDLFCHVCQMSKRLVDGHHLRLADSLRETVNRLVANPPGCSISYYKVVPPSCKLVTSPLTSINYRYTAVIGVMSTNLANEPGHHHLVGQHLVLF